MSELHNTYKWELVRAHVMRAHKGLCANPFGLHTNKGMVSPLGNYTAATVVHHIIPISYAPELAFTLSNLVPLCDDCHELAHDLLEHNLSDYKQRFGLGDDAIQSKSQKQKENKKVSAFFTGGKCYELEDGRWFCARCNRARNRRCSSCRC